MTGLNVWFREDITRALCAARVTSAAMQHSEPTDGDGKPLERRQAYYRGFIDALRVIAEAFGIDLIDQVWRE